MSKNTPSTMSFEHWGTKISITNPHSDIDIEEFFENCLSLAKAAGFSETSIKNYFDDGE
jgi:hypothetical protein